jgi:hypothetical protein
MTPIMASTRAGEGVTACSAGRAGRHGVRAYPGATRGGADFRSPQRTCLRWEDALPRGACHWAAQPAWEREPASLDA